MPLLDQDRFLSVKETAEYLRVSQDTVRMMLRTGIITGVRVGHQFRIGGDVLQMYLDAHEVPG